MADYDPAALFGPSEGGGDSEAPASGGEFDMAFDDFISAFESGDNEAARMAFKQAVQACYAEETAAPEPALDLGI